MGLSLCALIGVGRETCQNIAPCRPVAHPRYCRRPVADYAGRPPRATHPFLLKMRGEAGHARAQRRITRRECLDATARHSAWVE